MAPGPRSTALLRVRRLDAARGIAAEPLWLKADADDRDPGAPSAARGRIVVASGMISPDSARRAEFAGAVGLVHVNDDEILHEMIATTIWGTPSTSSAERPDDSYRVDYEECGRAASLVRVSGQRLRLVAEVQRGWAEIPLVVAEVPGQTRTSSSSQRTSTRGTRG